MKRKSPRVAAHLHAAVSSEIRQGRRICVGGDSSNTGGHCITLLVLHAVQTGGSTGELGAVVTPRGEDLPGVMCYRAGRYRWS